MTLKVKTILLVTEEFFEIRNLFEGLFIQFVKGKSFVCGYQ